ncbi:PadR family transcriptional regulator [Actinomadura sp. NBRC 104412]|uniref:PadR family transcriptional regulator n=1 Tax=Actinomadura sp. NBRC 104412 TaxID=3032203 RepID=UPI002552144C|nr:PadR family transcriptional regulator [Actinomadura sp. NBRC 104412]
MSLKYAVLAALLEGEASGYELAKRFDASVANFWTATPQQLYRELDRLEGEGLLTARVVEQQRRPNKRMFRITESGRLALRDFTAAPTRPPSVREDLLVKVQAVDAGDTESVIAAIEERMEWSRAKLARYDRLRARMLAGRDEDEYLRTVERVGPYLTLMRGRGHEQENLRWSEVVLAILRERSGVADCSDPRLP